MACSRSRDFESRMRPPNAWLSEVNPAGRLGSGSIPCDGPSSRVLHRPVSAEKGQEALRRTCSGNRPAHLHEPACWQGMDGCPATSHGLRGPDFVRQRRRARAPALAPELRGAQDVPGGDRRPGPSGPRQAAARGRGRAESLVPSVREFPLIGMFVRSICGCRVSQRKFESHYARSSSLRARTAGQPTHGSIRSRRSSSRSEPVA